MGAATEAEEESELLIVLLLCKILCVLFDPKTLILSELAGSGEFTRIVAKIKSFYACKYESEGVTHK